MALMEIPIDTTMAGIYAFAREEPDVTRKGNIILRGTNAGPIGTYPFEQGMETYYYAAPASSGEVEQFKLKLVSMANPSDSKFLTAVTAIVEGETQLGVQSVVPTWETEPTLPSTLTYYTMTNVSQGKPGHDYSPLYHKVSLTMPVDEHVLLPTWYTDIEDLFSIFGGNPQQGAPIAQGMTATFSKVTSGGEGYPQESWWWTGREIT